MGLAVVTVVSGGLPVVESTIGGTPVTEATNGRGVPVTRVVGKPGMPVVFETIGAAVPGAPVLTTFATFDDVPALGSVVSNGGLTVTHGSTSSNAGVKSLLTKTTGKFYFELLTEVSVAGGYNIGITSGTLSDMGNILNSTEVVTGTSSIIYSNDVTTSKNLGTTAVGDIFCYAIDLTARRAWIRRNAGLWNADGAADPVAGTNGVVIEAGAFAPGVRFSNANTATAAVTGNFGQSAFAFTPPSGFSLGWGT